MKFHVCTILLLSIFGCSSHMDTNRINIEWKKVAKTNKPIDFGQIDSVLDGYIISYSHSTVSGGFRIMRLNTVDDSLISKTLFENNKNTIQFVNIKEDDIGFIQYDFEENTLRTKFFFSYDSGKTWSEIKTPLKGGIRKFLYTEVGFIVEGYLRGKDQIYQSTDKGNSWKKIDLSKGGVKGAKLIENSEALPKIFIKGDLRTNFLTHFLKKDKTLLLYDIKNSSFKELLDFNDEGGFSYIKPISKNKNLHVVIDGRKLKIFSLQDKEMNLIEKFKLPNGTRSWIKNIFLGKEYYIVTTRKDKLKGKILSWISYDKGHNWLPYNHKKELQLIYSSFGELFMTDIDNNILLRKKITGYTPRTPQ